MKARKVPGSMLNPMRTLGHCCWRLRCRELLIGLLALIASAAHARDFMEEWNHALPDLVLTNVHIDAGSLSEAWNQLSRDHLARTVLFLPQDAVVDRPFRFAAERTLLRELLDTLSTHYDDFTWSQDPDTGVIWMHPRQRALASLLTAEIEVPEEQVGLPMFTGVLLPIIFAQELGVHTSMRGHVAATHNYAVTVPAGTLTLRELVNLICRSRPTKSFLIAESARSTALMPVNLVIAASDPVPSGVRGLWELLTGEEPERVDPARLLPYLTSTRPEDRALASAIVQARIWQLGKSAWQVLDLTTKQALWVAVALADVMIKQSGAGHSDLHAWMTQHVTDAFWQTANPVLATAVALELARLGGDQAGLEHLRRRSFTEREAALLRAERQWLVSIVRRSPSLLEMVESRDERLAWLSAPGVERDALRASHTRVDPDIMAALGVPESYGAYVELAFEVP